jgi:hypothetical protein
VREKAGAGQAWAARYHSTTSRAVFLLSSPDAQTSVPDRTLLLCGTVATFAASDNSYKITCDGGSVNGLKSGNGVKLFLDSNQFRIVKDKEDLATIPAAAVTEVSYGQDVHRRVGAAIGSACSHWESAH